MLGYCIKECLLCNDKKITWDVLSLPSNTNECRDAEFLEFFLHSSKIAEGWQKPPAKAAEHAEGLCELCKCL
jgi:hypothetical protein